MNLTTATPQEIDRELSKIQNEANNLRGRIAARTQILYSTSRFTSESARESARQDIEKAQAKLVELGKQAEPFNAEFARRGGWTRAFLVITSGQGHVHRTMDCTTCYPTTQFHWLTDLSDHNEQEIVDLAGEGACTVCYKSAPVELRLDRPRAVFTEDEKRKLAEREERAAKRAAADAAKITVTDYREFSRTRDKEFKTVRAVTNQIASDLSTLTWYGPANFQSELHNIGQMREALAAKGVEYDYDKALASARKKTVRDGGVSKF